ncbi:MAG TPA: tetratricopeptide repeat protein [Atopobiaceae bacterium]|nr:tetratricopeptide repeat protein [Atopobiaceae bacterium]
MSQTNMTDEILRAEGYLMQDHDEQAIELLSRLAEDAEEYVDRNCPTTESLQWFAFPTLFDRLAYRRVENDPRELRDIGEPLNRLYCDLALASVKIGDYEMAIEALKQAVRWNPMDCGARLDLADLFRISGDPQEYLALTFTVFERASDARHLARAFLTFANYFEVCEKPKTAAAALHAARKLETDDSALAAALNQASGTGRDPDSVTDAEAAELLAAEGLPDGANAEIAICLLMCASDAASAGERDLATTLTLRARDLVGEPAAMALLDLIRSSEAGE